MEVYQQSTYKCDRGEEGVRKSPNLSGVIYGWFLSQFSKPRVSNDVCCNLKQKIQQMPAKELEAPQLFFNLKFKGEFIMGSGF